MKADRDLLAAKLSLADFVDHAVLLGAPGVPRLVDDLAARGVEKPVLPGIMPVVSLRSVPRMAEMGAAVPPGAVARFEEAGRTGRGRGGPPCRHRHRRRSSARSCSPPGRRGCTSTRSTGRALHARSTPLSACGDSR